MGIVSRSDVAVSSAVSLRSPRALVLSERRLLIYVLDCSALAVALMLGLLSADSTSAALDRTPEALGYWVAILILIWTIAAAIFDTYDLRRCARVIAGTSSAYRGVIVTTAAYAAVPFVTAPILMSRAALFTFVITSFATIGLIRVGYARLLTQPKFARRAVIAGSGEGARLAHAALTAAAREYEVVGIIVPDEAAAAGSGLPILGTYESLRDLVKSTGIDEVVVADEMSGVLPKELIALSSDGLETVHFAELFEFLTGSTLVLKGSQQWFGVLPHRAGGGRAYDLMKRTVDLLVAATAIVFLAPVLAAIVLSIRLEDGGPVFYRQTRLGLFGKSFDLVKFRSMHANAEVDGVQWASKGDPRRTRVGRLLRSTHLDELPQLWNVVTGTMSLIGPRPERGEFAGQLEREFAFYRLRLLVRPGITGWAQVRFSYADSFDDSLQKLRYDLYYVKHRSPFLDLVIALKTIGVMLRASGH